MKAYKDCANFVEDDDLWAQQFQVSHQEDQVAKFQPNKSMPVSATTPCFAKVKEDVEAAKKELDRIGR